MKKVLSVIGILVALFLGIGLVLPTTFTVERSITIDATSSEIHYFVDDLKQWPKWGPWQEADPTIVTTIGDISHGVGASQIWQGESGSGSLTVTQSNMVSGIHYDMSFGGDPSSYEAGLRYQAQGQKTQVTWYMTGDMKPMIIGGYFALLMDTFVGDMFYQGLVNLKKISEAKSH